MTSTTRVVVTVADENDEIPMFTELQYRVSVPEKSATSEEVAIYQVIALDGDTGANGDIKYAIAPGRASDHFRIHPKTGMIYSQREFLRDSIFDLKVT